MTIEPDLVAALDALCGNKCFADAAPTGTAVPFITYQQVGGSTINPLSGAAPGLRNARIQINCWHSTRGAANALMRQVEDVLRASPYFAIADGALMAIVQDGVPLKGAQQDFSLWWQ